MSTAVAVLEGIGLVLWWTLVGLLYAAFWLTVAVIIGMFYLGMSPLIIIGWLAGLNGGKARTVRIAR